MFCSLGWWMQVHRGFLLGSLLLWSMTWWLGWVAGAFCPLYRLLKVSCLLREPPWSLCLEISMLLRYRCGTGEQAQRRSVERKKAFPCRGAWLTRWLPIQRASCWQSYSEETFPHLSLIESTYTRSLTCCLTEISHLQVTVVLFAD